MANFMADIRHAGEQLRQVPAKELGRRFLHHAKEDDLPGLGAEFAYHWIYAIPPLLILTFLLAALVDRVTSFAVASNLRSVISNNAPADTASVLNGLVDRAVAQVGGGVASLGGIAAGVLALWSGSSGVGVLMKAFNRAYDVEEGRSYIKKKLVAVGLTLVVTLFINLAFVLLVFGQRIGSWIAGKAGLGSAFDLTWGLLRWPIAIIAVAITLAVLYYAAPDVEQTFRWISPGAVVAAVLWFLTVALFGLYLRLSNPGSAYGAVGGVIVLLTFLYLTGIEFLIGAEINAVLERRYDPATVHDLATDPKAQPDARAEARRRARPA